MSDSDGSNARARTALALSVLLAAAVTQGCRSVGEQAARPRLEFSLEPDAYSPLMSSAVGIGIVPRFSPGKASPPVRYHWHANYGYFVQWGPPEYQVRELGPDATTEGKVYWAYDPVDMDQRDKPPVRVTVAVRDAKTLDVRAESRIDIGWDGLDTAVVRGKSRYAR